MSAKDITEAFRELLLTDPNIAGIVSDRIVADQLPEGMATPAIVFYEISSNIDNSIEPDVIVDCSISRFQVEAFASTRPMADKVQRMIVRRCGNFIGKIGDVGMKTSRLTGQSFETDRPELGSAGFRYLSRVDYQITHYPVDIS